MHKIIQILIQKPDHPDVELNKFPWSFFDFCDLARLKMTYFMMKTL